MSDRLSPADLAPEERAVHDVLAAARPVAPPIGFRDGVMSRLRRERRVTWEWIVAALLALPSVTYLARQVAVHGQDFVEAFGNIALAASTQTSGAFFFVDGLTVVALALLGLASAVAAHALLGPGGPDRTVAR